MVGCSSFLVSTQFWTENRFTLFLRLLQTKSPRNAARKEARKNRGTEMTKVIRNGTVVTADRTWKADVLMQHGKIVAIGSNLHGDHEFDATGRYVMPGGIDPHTHLEMPF